MKMGVKGFICFLVCFIIIFITGCELLSPDDGSDEITAVLDKSVYSMEEGESIALTATVSGAKSSAKMSWASDKTSVATVEGVGNAAVVTAESVGKANINFSVDDVVLTKCVLTVTQKSDEGGDDDGGDDDGGDDGDETPVYKSKLHIGVSLSAFDNYWIKEIAALFEQEYKDTSFKEGEKGVEIIIDIGNYAGTALTYALNAGGGSDIYFTGSVQYHELVKSGLLADITDVVVGGNDGSSIEDRMNGGVKDYLLTDDKYYAVPYYDGMFGIIYDADLFAKNGFAIPSTWSEFKELLENMHGQAIMPFTWTGTYATNYTNQFLSTIWASYEGKDNFMLGYTLDGTDSQLGQITKENGYTLQNQAGKLKALEVAHHIVRNNYYSLKSLSGTTSHIAAQSEFLLSSLSPEKETIAMLIDGTWWECEATGTIKEIQNEYGLSQTDRDFRFMPIPKFSSQNNTGDNLFLGVGGNSLVIINKNTKNINLAKLFIDFSTSNESLISFTKSTGSPRPFAYEMPLDELEKMTGFSQNVWEIYTDPDTQIVYPLSSLETVYKNAAFFSDWKWSATIGATTYASPMLTFKNNPSMTPEIYRDGLVNYSQSRWSGLLGINE